MRVSFVITQLIRPVTSHEHRNSNTGWVCCEVLVTKCAANPSLVGKSTRYRGELPSCAPYFEYTLSVTLERGQLVPAKSTTAELRHRDATNITADDRAFMLQEVAYANPKLSREELRTLTFSRRDPLFVNSCQFFRISYEQMVAKRFPNQKAVIHAMPLEQLKKCIGFLKKQPWLLMFRKWSRRIFKLKEMSLGLCMGAIRAFGVAAPRETRVAMNLCAYINRERKSIGHTIFPRIPVVEQYLERNLADQAYVDDALRFLEYRCLKFPSPNAFAKLDDARVAELICDHLTAIRDRDFEPPEIEQGILTDEQFEAVQHVQDNWLTMILGGPGHGKSEAIVHLVKSHKKVLVMTYVGMAVDMLQSRLDGYENVYTIHYVYYRAKMSDWVADFDLVILDETSNIDSRLFERIMSVLPSAARLVLVGDLYQINPIKPGNPFRDLAEAFPEHVFHFTRNLRVAPDARMLADASVHIRNNEIERINFDTPNLRLVPRTSIQEMAEKFVATHAYEILNAQVICLRNDARKHVNDAVEAELIEMGVLTPPRGAPRIKGGKRIYPGVKVMFTKNYKEAGDYAGVRNGELGQVVKTKKVGGKTELTLKHKKVLLGDGAISPLNVELGYAVTSNKSQGSEWGHVVFYIHPDLGEFWSREYPYVAVSRAKNSCTIVGTMDELKAICKNRAPPRNTALADRIATTMLVVDTRGAL